jgi:predicted NAD/FAD-dependent oxidoreductase
MAGYPPESADELNFSWQGIEFTQHPTLSKIILDSHKRLVPEYPVYVMHSTPDFAQKFDLSEDLSAAISIILQDANDLLHPALARPQWSQIHRWRYAIPRFSLNSDFLWAERSLPLLFCGDGYGANQDSTLQPIERAILSGLSAANALLTTASF